MDPKIRASLVKKRGVAKSKVSNIKNYVDGLSDKTDKFKIKVRLDALQQAWQEYIAVQDKLEIEDDETQQHDRDRAQFSEVYFDLQARMAKLIDVEEARSSTPSLQSVESHKANVKLPPIRVPVFNNNITDFRHFHDTFTSLVLNNDRLDKIQQYYYLLSAVSGEAHKLIENLPVTADNFDIAWKLICERYNNPRLVANNHIKALLAPPATVKDCPRSLRTLLSHCKGNLNAIEALKLKIPLHELIISQLYLDKVDASTRKDWELTLSVNQSPSLDDFLQFLEKRCHALELIKASMPQNVLQEKTHRFTRDVKHSYVSTNNVCVVCRLTHPVYKCKRFRESNLEERWYIVKNNHLCFNCLASEHIAAKCPSENVCRQCGQTHHTLLHQLRSVSPGCAEGSVKPPHSRETFEGLGSYCSLKPKSCTQILLATVTVAVQDNFGQLQKCRALLDSGSQTNFITESLVQKLRLKKTRISFPIQGINEVKSEAKHSVCLNFQSTAGNYHATITCAVLPRITGDMPSFNLHFSDWNLPDDIQLADPLFYKPSGIDLLLGAEMFFKILRRGQKTRPGNYPVLQETELGWILSGTIETSTPHSVIQSQHSFFARGEMSLDDRLQRFWELEDLPNKPQSVEELKCEEHFINNTSRDSTGRYIVRLPRRPEVGPVGESYSQAKRRLIQLERRMQREPDVQVAYSEFMLEYEQLSHMTEVTLNNERHREVFYLPHHPVFKSSSSTTRTRVVFDASSKSSNGVSLNDTLMVGPTIQQDLYSIILRFRMKPIAFSADICQMFRQINVHHLDAPLQRILWRPSPNQKIQIYELKTVTYGTSCAPFLATRVLQQLADDEMKQFPRAAQVLKRDFYVDDLITATENLEEALQLQQDLIVLLNKGGFKLRKFSANRSELLEAIPPSCRETQNLISLDNHDGVKTLGLLWNPSTDQFLIRSISGTVGANSSPRHFTTKREVASIVASTFDPLGLISPIIITYKVFLQDLWRSGFGWDEPLSNDLQERWFGLLSLLHQVNLMKIDRLVIPYISHTNVQLHGFCDASERAYGACLYIRTRLQEKVTSNLLCAKSRVAPVRQITLPRLELCGAALLAKLIEKAVPVVGTNIHSIHLYTDSMIVLAWIMGTPTRWKTFVANRVSQIQQQTSVDSWRHVPTYDNPADLISRGTNPEVLQSTQMWWRGPRWLEEQEEFWVYSAPNDLPENLPEVRPIASLVTTTGDSEDIITKYSSHIKLIRVIAYCKRFIHNCRNSQEKYTKPLSSTELEEANLICIRLTQGRSYSTEITALSKGQSISQKSKILCLNPFLDEMKILRVGGRLINSDLAYDRKHQIILPPNHHFTNLLIQHEHQRLLHAETQLLLASLRARYWIPRARQTIRAVIHKCLPCFRLKVRDTNQLMGQLPKARIQMSRPFLSSGVDFAGPVNVKLGSRKARAVYKCYAAIFICFSTKAVHIEPVTGLTSEAFIAALRRFVSRRGHIQDLYSDNATTFVGANKELQHMLKDKQFNEEVNNHAAASRFKWHFIPARSPHFGGLWESAVKSMKFHFRRVVGETVLTYEELATLLTQIEACLNSRPLCALSDDPSDPSVLTPGHFLIGAPLMSIPDHVLTDAYPNRLSRWQHLQQMQQHWWSRWSKDYLHTLQQRKKWPTSKPNLQAGTLVLVKEDHQAPLQWKIGIIEQVFPGRDGLIRVADVRCSSSTFRRAITKLVPLPSSQ